MCFAKVSFRQINEVEWTAEYVEIVLLQNRTKLYAICFLAWYLWNVVVRISASKAFLSLFLLQRLKSLESVEVQMRFERGSPLRGFSLGATAGTLAGPASLSETPFER